jgi:ATP:corrinoid adenosyltransferase
VSNIIVNIYEVILIKKSSTTSNPEWRYFGSGYEKTTKSIDQAVRFNNTSVKDFVAAFQKCANVYGDDNVAYARVTVTTVTEHLSTDEGDILEERQRVALAKLSRDDVKALGLENIAMYSMLKFHKTESDDDEDDTYN